MEITCAVGVQNCQGCQTNGCTAPGKPRQKSFPRQESCWAAIIPSPSSAMPLPVRWRLKLTSRRECSVQRKDAEVYAELGEFLCENPCTRCVKVRRPGVLGLLSVAFFGRRKRSAQSPDHSFSPNKTKSAILCGNSSNFASERLARMMTVNFFSGNLAMRVRKPIVSPLCQISFNP